MGATYERGPFGAAYEAHLRACDEASAKAREACAPALKEALASFFRENPALRAITWETWEEYNDEGGTYTTLSLGITTDDDEAPLRHNGEEVAEHELQQALHDLLWGTFRIEDLAAFVDEQAGEACLTREQVLAAAGPAP